MQVILSSLSAVACVALLGLSAGSVSAQQQLLVGGGSRSGVYYQVALQLCAAVNNTAGNRLHCLGRPSLGSVFNINAVDRGLLDFGIAQSDRVWQATHGQADWSKSGPVSSLRSVFTVHAETVLLVVRKDAGIASVQHLAARRVNIGNPGSGHRGNAEDVLRIYGIDPRTDLVAVSLQQTEASRALIDGKIDAFFYTVGNPSAAISDPADRVGIDLVALDSPGIRELARSRPYYVMTTIPAGTYRSVDRDVTTFAVKATVVTSAGQDEELVYETVKALFDRFEAFKASHAAFAPLTRAGMLDGLSAPLHAGARRFYEEAGQTVPMN